MRLQILFVLILICLGFSNQLLAQEPPEENPAIKDTANMPRLSELPVEIAPIDSAQSHSVKTATLLALLPGAGQIYNRKYWKVPIVYAGLGTTIYFARENHLLYREFLDAFFASTDDDSSTIYNGTFTPAQLIELQDIYRRYRDLNLILTAVVYGLQILDAHVDAHLFYYDISDDLSLRWEPSTFNTAFGGNAIGAKMVIQLK
jgi:hypothetical protein